MQDFGDKLGDVFNAYIGRIVAFVIAPVLVVAVPPVVEALNNVLGTDFTSQQVSNIAIGTLVGLAAVVYKWLHNRGEWENKLAELHMLYQSGAQIVNNAEMGPTPSAAPRTANLSTDATDRPQPEGGVGGKPGF